MNEKKRIVEEGYNRIAEIYSESRKEMSEGDRKYIELLLARLPSGSKVLDLGCGSGIPITKLLAERYDVIGVDISWKQIELAKRFVPEAEFLKGDMTQVYFPPETFEAVCSFVAIIHVPREEHSALLKRLYGMMKPGGILLVTMGSSDWVSTDDDRFFGVKMYWSHFDTDTSKRIVEEAGFRIIESSIEGQEFEEQYEESLYVLAEKAGGSEGLG